MDHIFGDMEHISTKLAILQLKSVVLVVKKNVEVCEQVRLQ